MNKRILHNSLCATFVLFSIQPVAAFWGHSSLVGSLIDDSFPILFYTHKAPALEATALHEDLNKFDAELLAIQQETSNLRNALLSSKAEKDSIIATIKTTKEKLEQSLATCSTLLTSFEKDIQGITEKHAYTIKEYTIDEKDATHSNKYGVKVSVPGFKPEDLTVSISVDTKNGITRQRLTVTGTKQPTQTTNNTAKVSTDHQFTSSSFVHDRQKQIEYKNGSIKATFDLPSNIDTKEESYSMSFDHEKEILTVEFEKTDASKKKVLKYTDQQKSHTHDTLDK